MYDNDYEGEVIENEFDDSGVVFEKPIELDIFAEDAWDDTALLAAHESLTLHPESNSTESIKINGKMNRRKLLGTSCSSFSSSASY